MKKTILSALVFGTLMSGKLTASDGYSESPSDNPAKSTVVSFNEVNPGDVLYIRDRDGISYYSEKVKANGIYTKLFNLASLPENQYYFEMEKADKITLIPFKVEGESVTLNNEMRKNVVKPQLVTRIDQVFLTRDVKDAQSLKVDIYYRGRELVHSEEFEKAGRLLRKYNFSNSRKGEYLFLIKYDDRVLEEYVSVL